ncbi:DUF1190 domain-containing protein [uncultured Erythrobacter sp.]|uniref:DUF1190 domain-containing protein n=2 Tax=uncultured Erythrobacter sp. TaxID=263913 RepID=UPI002603AF38|nr:DUF1190 domain-containing protein [uncultured Erythrobacter sp.]
MKQDGFAQRKRSSRVALTTMAALTGGAMLSACGSDAPETGGDVADANAEEVQVFENVFACAKVTGKTTQECSEMREEAIAVAAKEAPRFAALQDCEAEYGAGQCVEADKAGDQPVEEQARSGRSHFSPFVVAWFSRGDKAGNSPLFKSKAGGFQSANGARLGYAGAPGKYFASNRAMERAKSVPKVKPASKMAKAAGFGSRNKSWNLADRNSAKSSASARSRGG